MKSFLKFLYWTIIPMAIGAVMFYYLDKMNASLLYKAFIFLLIAIPIATIRVFVGAKLFKQTLADKIISCYLRKKYGKEYCAVCPDGYNCAAGDMKKT
jgi:hypothetical protein